MRLISNMTKHCRQQITLAHLSLWSKPVSYTHLPALLSSADPFQTLPLPPAGSSEDFLFRVLPVLPESADAYFLPWHPAEQSYSLCRQDPQQDRLPVPDTGCMPDPENGVRFGSPLRGLPEYGSRVSGFCLTCLLYTSPDSSQVFPLPAPPNGALSR